MTVRKNDFSTSWGITLRSLTVASNCFVPRMLDCHSMSSFTLNLMKMPHLYVKPQAQSIDMRSWSLTESQNYMGDVHTHETADYMATVCFVTANEYGPDFEKQMKNCNKL